MRFSPTIFLPAALAVVAPAFGRSAPAIFGFDGRDLWMKATSGTPDGAYSAQYFPKDETPERWTERFTLRIVPMNADPEAVADDVVKRVLARKPGDRLATAAAYLYGADGSALVDYTISNGTDSVERDIHRYFKSGDRLVTYQYTRRFSFHTGDVRAAEAFLADNAVKTPAYFRELDRPDLPLRPPPGAEETLIRAAAVRRLAAFERDRETRRANVRREFREKKLSAAEASTRLAHIDAERAPEDDALAALRPVPLKPRPVAESKVKPEQREAL